MSRRKEPAIPNELLDQLLAGGDAGAALRISSSLMLVGQRATPLRVAGEASGSSKTVGLSVPGTGAVSAMAADQVNLPRRSSRSSGTFSLTVC